MPPPPPPPPPLPSVTRFRQDNADIRSRFQTLFAEARPEIRVVWENAPPDAPTDESPFPKLDEEYVRVVIRQSASRQVTMSRPRSFRHFGVVAVYIQTRFGKGTGRSEEIADQVGAVLGAVTVGDMVFRDPRYLQDGVVGGQWFHATLTVAYWSTFQES